MGFKAVALYLAVTRRVLAFPDIYFQCQHIMFVKQNKTRRVIHVSRDSDVYFIVTYFRFYSLYFRSLMSIISVKIILRLR